MDSGGLDGPGRPRVRVACGNAGWPTAVTATHSATSVATPVRRQVACPDARLLQRWRLPPGCLVECVSRARAELREATMAYAKTAGVSVLLANEVPHGSRAVVVLGSALTEPPAVERRLVGCPSRPRPGRVLGIHVPSQAVSRPAKGHPPTFSTSTNRTGAGWTTNVEQFKELTFAHPSAESSAQRERHELLWDHGVESKLFRRQGEWTATGNVHVPQNPRARGPATAATSAGSDRPAHWYASPPVDA